MIDGTLFELLKTEPAIVITGPRSCGKSTTAQRHAASTTQLDRPSDAAAFLADPDTALARKARPALLDEWQEAPDVLGAVKRAVDAGAPPGSFVITGSVDADSRGFAAPTFGRTRTLTLWPVTQREIDSHLVPDSPTPFLDMLVSGDIDQWRTAKHPWTIENYFDAVVTGGYPRIAFDPQPNLSRLDGLAEDITHSEASRISPRLVTPKLGAWLTANAEQTARQPAMKTLLDVAGVSQKTGERYDHLLQAMFVLQLLPGWYSTRIKRLTKTPQRHLVDTGLCAAILGVTADDLLDDAQLGGHLLASFVAQQLRPEVSLSPRTRLFHWRTDDGKEIDLVLEHRHKLFGIEVTRTVNPFSPRDPATSRKIRHLQAMRRSLGHMFGGGVVLYPGDAVGLLDTGIIAAPISCLWS